MEYKLDWTQFTRRIYIDKDAAEVFKLWTSQDGMECWFLESAKFLRNGQHIDSKEAIQAGDEYLWKWYGWDGEQKGVILELVENSILRFGFGKAGDVLVELAESDDGSTELKLTQYNIPTDEDSLRNYYYGCTMGWSFWMINCKLFAEHGMTINHKSNPLPDKLKAQLVNA